MRLCKWRVKYLSFFFVCSGIVYSFSNRWKSRRLSASSFATSKSGWYDRFIRITFWKWKSHESCSSVRSIIRSIDFQVEKIICFHSFSGEFDYELYLRYDLYTKRNTQWFYFRLQNIRADKRYRFTIVNFFKVIHSIFN